MLPAASVAVRVRLCFPVVSAAVVFGPGPAAVGDRPLQQRCTVKHLDRCVGFRRPAQGQRIVALVMPSPTAPLSVEARRSLARAGTTVSIVTLSAPEAAPVL